MRKAYLSYGIRLNHAFSVSCAKLYLGRVGLFFLFYLSDSRWHGHIVTIWYTKFSLKLKENDTLASISIDLLDGSHSTSHDSISTPDARSLPWPESSISAVSWLICFLLLIGLSKFSIIFFLSATKLKFRADYNSTPCGVVVVVAAIAVVPYFLVQDRVEIVCYALLTINGGC